MIFCYGVLIWQRRMPKSRGDVITNESLRDYNYFRYSKPTHSMMEALRSVVTVSFPSYLRRLPIPKTFGGFATLTGEEWLHLLPFITTSLLILIALLNLLLPERKRAPMINQEIKKNKEKVADVMDIEDLGDKEAFCRCWRSKKFPYCDGSHNRHNQDTGDNVGPLVLKKLRKEEK